jgi:hypothetical protein
LAQIERTGEQRAAELNARLSSMSDLNAARAEAARASAARSAQGPADNTERDIERDVVSEALRLSRPGKDPDGFEVPGLPIGAARDSAQVLVRGARGLPIPGRGPQQATPPARPGSALLGGLGLQPQGGGLEAEFPNDLDFIAKARRENHPEDAIRQYLRGRQ